MKQPNGKLLVRDVCELRRVDMRSSRVIRVMPASPSHGHRNHFWHFQTTLPKASQQGGGALLLPEPPG